MSMNSFEQAAHDLGISVDALRAVAPGGIAPDTPSATETTAGTVLQGAAVANAVAAPTQAEFNALLASLRAAGTIAT
jgi:hypothetical protein